MTREEKLEAVVRHLMAYRASINANPEAIVGPDPDAVGIALALFNGPVWDAAQAVLLRYDDPSFPERTCDKCGRQYRGPAVYCSLECAVADA